MEQETKIVCNKKWRKMNRGDASGGAIYALGVIGAIIYYIQHTDTFLIGAFGVLKAFVWPAFVVYKLIEFLKF